MSFPGAVRHHCRDKPRKSVYDALKEVGRRTSIATKRLSEQVFLTCDSALTDSEAQKFTECSILADINEMELKCDDLQAFHSVMPQYLVSQNFADVPFKIDDRGNKTPLLTAYNILRIGGGITHSAVKMFLMTQQLKITVRAFDQPIYDKSNTPLFTAYLTSSEFVVESVDGKAVFAVAFPEADQISPLDLHHVGKVKHPQLGVQLYRIMQLSNTVGKEGRESFVIRKCNDQTKEPYMKIAVKRSFWYRVGKWLGLTMDSRIFLCRTGDKMAAKIRPRIGWNAANLGYRIGFDEEYKNYTGKTVCLAFTLLMFLKYSPLDFEHLLSSQ